MQQPDSPAASSRQMRLVTSDLDEAIDAVSRVYCPHEITIGGAQQRVASTLEVLGDERRSVVKLSYSAPVRIDAGHFDNLLLIKSCTHGSASARQGAPAIRFAAGETVPLSPWQPTVLDFDSRFVQRSVRLDVQGIEMLCAQHLNRPLDAALRFRLQPFSAALESAWDRTVSFVLDLDRLGASLPPAASRRLDEFMMSLLLQLHPHNYTEALRAPQTLATPRAVREAEHLMRTAAPGEALTVATIAAAVGVSLRSLEAGFREWRQMTPTQYYRSVRLEAARAELEGGTSASVSTVALKHGFLHLSRFSAHYRAMFQESPKQTLLRARSRTRRS